MLNSTNSSIVGNGTTADEDRMAAYILLVTSLTVIGVLTLSANTLLLITLLRFKSKHLKESTRWFLMYKALGHACHGLAVMARPHIRYTQCVHFGRFSRTALGTVVGGMFLLSLDSFITITQPYRHTFIMNPRTAKVAMLLCCLLHVLMFLLSALVPAPAVRPLSFCTQNNSQVAPWVLVTMVLLCILLLFMAMWMQAYNIWSLWKRSNAQPPAANPPFPLVFVSNAIEPIDNQPQNPVTNVTRLDRLQRLLTVWVISIFVCWMPSNITVGVRAIMDMYSIGEKPLLGLAQPFFTVLPLVDGMLQPCLAIALSQELRAAVKKLLCCGESCVGGNGVGTASNNVNTERGVGSCAASPKNRGVSGGGGCGSTGSIEDGHCSNACNSHEA